MKDVDPPKVILDELNALIAHADYPSLVAKLSELLKRYPTSSRVRLTLSQVYAKQSKWQEGYQLFLGVLKKDPKRPDLLSLQEIFLRKLERYEEAEAISKRLVELHPNYVKGRIQWLRYLRNNSYNEYLVELEDLITLAPYDPRVVYEYSLNSASIKIIPDKYPDQKALEALQSDTTLSLEDRKTVLFALGNLLLSQAEDDSAFEAFDKANKLIVRAVREFGSDLNIKLLFWKVNGLSKPDFVDRQLDGEPTSLPHEIIVVGGSRSGKSLVEMLICKNPDVTGVGESRSLADALQEFVGTKPNEIITYLRSAAKSTLERDARRYQECLSDVNTQYRVNTHPENIWTLPLLALWSPKTPIIFCTRDLLDHGISIYFKNYSDASDIFCDLHQIGRYIATYEELISMMMQTLPNPMIKMEYESLIQNPSEMIARLEKFLGIELPKVGEQVLKVENSPVRHILDSLPSIKEEDVYIDESMRGIGRRFERFLTPLIAGYNEVKNELLSLTNANLSKSEMITHSIPTERKAEEIMSTITIDGKDYDLDSLSDSAKAQLTSLQVTDAEIQRLNIQLAIAQTARNAYAKALGELLPKTKN
jgi:tetratricopeptide (TPR) repeat protein